MEKQDKYKNFTDEIVALIDSGSSTARRVSLGNPEDEFLRGRAEGWGGSRGIMQRLAAIHKIDLVDEKIRQYRVESAADRVTDIASSVNTVRQSLATAKFALEEILGEADTLACDMRMVADDEAMRLKLLDESAGKG